MKFIVFFLLSYTSIVWGQIEYIDRVEVELKDGYTDETMIGFGDKGFILQSKKEGLEKGNKEWKFEKYNTNLKPVKSSKILVGKEYFLDEYLSTDDKYFVLFRKYDQYIFLCLDIETMHLTKVEGEFPKKSSIKKSSVKKNIAILGDFVFFKTFVKQELFLFSLNWKTGDKDLIPIIIDGYKKKDMQVLEFQTLKKENEILLYVITYSKKERDLHVIQLNNKGEKQMSFKIKTNENIVDISGFKLDDTQYLFTGTYSKNSVLNSEGLFFCKVIDKKVDFIEFYNFLDLKEFLSYLPKRKEKKIEKKKARKESKGKELKINYRIAPHNIIKTSDGYVFIGEAYHSTYKSEYYVGGSSRTVFDGYKYTHALIAKFNKQGDLIWDHSFEFFQPDSDKPHKVIKYLKVDSEEDEINLVYTSNYLLISKYINYKNYVIRKDVANIEMKYESDKLKSSDTYLIYWYDDYFLLSGSQKIKNKGEESVDKKRKVLFMSKVKYN